MSAENKSAENKLKQLKVFLGLEKSEDVSLELSDQTVFATKLQEGEQVYFKKDEDQVPLPQGQYTTKDGKQLLSVDEKGVFVSLEEVKAAEEGEEDTKEEDPKEEGKAEYLTEDQAKELFVSREDFAILLEVVAELEKGKPISKTTIKRMYSYLSRAEEYYDASDTTACGTISFLLWGGKAAKAWAASKIKSFEK